MRSQLALSAPALLLLLTGVSCRVDFECRDACAKIYDRCDSAVAVQGARLPREQCELVCEEGGAKPEAALWLDCVEDSVCPGETADAEDRDLHRYDVDWCNPQFELLIHPG